MIKKAFKIVFEDRFYIFLAFFVSVLLFVLSTWLANLKLIYTVFFYSEASFLKKLEVLLNLFTSIGTNFTVFAIFYTVVIAVLFGINVSMLAFYMKKNRSIAGRGGAVSLGGLTSGIFGVGCASCGTLIIGPLLAFFGASGVLAYLPFGGQEFGVVAILLLLFSVYLIAKKISTPAVCKVSKKD